MITIDIDPILISLGPFSLSWHSLFMVIAIAVGVWLPAKLAAKAGLPVDRLYSLDSTKRSGFLLSYWPLLYLFCFSGKSLSVS